MSTLRRYQLFNPKMESESYEMLVPRQLRSKSNDNSGNHPPENLNTIPHPSSSRFAPSTFVRMVKAIGLNMSETWEYWGWEITASFLALAMVLIIFGTLYPHDGRPLPQWPFQISVNTLLSVYSMVLKAALSFVTVSCVGQLQWGWFSRQRPLYDLVRYDNAGRGAWGSTQLLWSQRLSQPLTALGGFLMILSLGIDPSIQQLISPSDCSVSLDDRKALLPRTNQFNDPSETPTFENDLSSAMLRGISELGNGIYPECTTGNCTFSGYYGTMGYCSSCEDSSSGITIESFNYSSFIANNLTDTSSSCQGNFTTQSIKSSLPKDSYISNPLKPLQLNVTFNETECIGGYPRTDYNNVEVARMDVLYHETSKGIQERPEKLVVKILGGKTPFSERNVDISTGQIIPGCQNNSSDSWRCGQYGAATCTLQPCVRVYNATVEAGRLTEHLVAQSGDLAWGKDPTRNTGLGMIDTHCLSPQNRSKLEEQGYIINTTSRWLPYSAAWGAVEGSFSEVEMTNSLLHQKCLYFFSTGFVSSMGPFIMQSYLSGTVISTASHDGVGGSTLSSFEGLQILQHIYNSGQTNLDRVQETFSNISDSLTTYIRTKGDSNYSDPAVGQVSHYATCIQVKWQWITFPSLMTTLTIAFFIMTIYTRPPRRFPAWKTSFLPWLMCGPRSPEVLNADESSETSYSIGSMENEAKEIMVTWKPVPNPHFQLGTPQ
ncbi:hypothetical protein F4779DRAFT_550816 [Xylariaceae sp. FL0662B]|nr:hypothetical protein F4779DRAFT_550816 [Xylariaceae sp. FL0662B]